MNELKYLFLIIVLLFTDIAAAQLVVQVENDPYFSPSLISVSEAGDDFVSLIENTNDSYLSVTTDNIFNKAQKKYPWYITVYKSDINWDNNLTLEIRRSSDGNNWNNGNGNNGNGNGNNGNGNGNSNNGKLYDGTSYREVTNLPAYFFGGGRETMNIQISFRLNNVSVLIPADDYETTILYTIYEY